MFNMSSQPPEGWLNSWPMEDGPRSQEGRVVIMGQSGVGKATLCNSLWGWSALDTDLTTTEPIRKFGLITLVDVGDDATETDELMYHLSNAAMMIYVLDARQPISTTDFRWIAKLRAAGYVLLVVLNRADTLEKKARAAKLSELEGQLARPVFPLRADDVAMVHDQLLPHVLRLCPELAVPLAAENATLRQRAVHKLINTSVMKSSLVPEPNGQLLTGPNQPLTEIQTALVKDIAALYGYTIHADDELFTSLSAMLDRIHHQLGRFLDPTHRLVGFTLAGTTTWLIGRLAVMYYEAGSLSIMDWAMGKRKPNFYEHSRR